MMSFTLGCSLGLKLKGGEKPSKRLLAYPERVSTTYTY